jgi:hypothetical protein
MLSAGIDMKYGFWIISIVTSLVAAASLGGQEAATGVTAASVPPHGPSPAMKDKSVDSGHYRGDKPCDSRLTRREKLQYFAHHSLGPGTFIGALFTAGPEMANPPTHYPRQWRQGAPAFGKLYGDALAFGTAQQTARFLTGVVLHEDPRYAASSSRNPYLRTVHAILFTAFDNSDSGRTTLRILLVRLRLASWGMPICLAGTTTPATQLHERKLHSATLP